MSRRRRQSNWRPTGNVPSAARVLLVEQMEADALMPEPAERALVATELDTLVSRASLRTVDRAGGFLHSKLRRNRLPRATDHAAWRRVMSQLHDWNVSHRPERKKQQRYPSFRLSYLNPRRVLNCARRHIRKEVMFALGFAGKRHGAGGSYRRTQESLWGC